MMNEPKQQRTAISGSFKYLLGSRAHSPHSSLSDHGTLSTTSATFDTQTSTRIGKRYLLLLSMSEAKRHFLSHTTAQKITRERALEPANYSTPRVVFLRQQRVRSNIVPLSVISAG